MIRTLPIALLIFSSAMGLSACAPPEQIEDDEKAVLDCLASHTVVKLVQEISAGLAAGKQPDELSNLQAVLTADGLATAKKLFPRERMHHTYFEFNVARRTTAVQVGLKANNPASKDYEMMIETLELGETCTIDGAGS